MAQFNNLISEEDQFPAWGLIRKLFYVTCHLVRIRHSSVGQIFLLFELDFNGLAQNIKETNHTNFLIAVLKKNFA